MSELDAFLTWLSLACGAFLSVAVPWMFTVGIASCIAIGAAWCLRRVRRWYHERRINAAMDRRMRRGIKLADKFGWLPEDIQ